MDILRRNFRVWWQPPRNLADRPETRTVTFLELFFDLVYVVVVAELAHALAVDVSWAGIGRFVFLFVMVWWAWVNGTLYHDLHGNNDIRTRVFTFLQMGSVAAMAVFAHNAIGDGSIGFALSFALFQFFMVLLWWRTGVHDPDHRPLSQPYVAGFLVTMSLFIISVFVAEPLRYYLWGVALLLSLLLPVVFSSIGRDDPAIQAQMALSMDITPSLVERFGLLTIIVLGEVLVGTVQGVAGQKQLTWAVGITAALGMLIAIAIWWFYFDAVSHHRPQAGRNSVLAWMYLHLPLTIGIVAVGAAVLNVVEHSGEGLPDAVRWLLIGACALVLAAIILLIRVIQVEAEHRPIYRRAGRAALAAAVLIGLLGFTNLGTIPLLIVVNILLLAPVLYSLLAWVELAGAA